MPIYEYRCEEHGKFEELEENPKKHRACPECGGIAARVWSAPGKPLIAFRAGYDTGAGQYFNTERQRQNWLAATGRFQIDHGVKGVRWRKKIATA